MSITRHSSEPPRESIAPRHESLRNEFKDRFDPQPPNYGETRLWLVARDAHSLFAYWELNPAEHPEVPVESGVPLFILRILRADGSVETTVQILPGAGDCTVNVCDANAEYTAEIGFYTREGVWCFLAHSGSTLTPPEGLTEDAGLRLPAEKLRALFEARGGVRKNGDHAGWTDSQEKMLTRILESDASRIKRKGRG